MSGFKNFLMQGQLVVVAVGLSIALAFSTLVKAFTDAVITPLVRAAGGGGVTGLGFTVRGQLVDLDARSRPSSTSSSSWRSSTSQSSRRTAPTSSKRGVAVFTEPPPTKACPACLSDGLPLEATKCRYCATELTVEQSGGLAEPA